MRHLCREQVTEYVSLCRERYLIEDRVEIGLASPNMPAVLLRHPNGSEVMVRFPPVTALRCIVYEAVVLCDWVLQSVLIRTYLVCAVPGMCQKHTRLCKDQLFVSSLLKGNTLMFGYARDCREHNRMRPSSNWQSMCRSEAEKLKFSSTASIARMCNRAIVNCISTHSLFRVHARCMLFKLALAASFVSYR